MGADEYFYLHHLWSKSAVAFIAQINNQVCQPKRNFARALVLVPQAVSEVTDMFSSDKNKKQLLVLTVQEFFTSISEEGNVKRKSAVTWVHS